MSDKNSKQASDYTWECIAGEEASVWTYGGQRETYIRQGCGVIEPRVSEPGGTNYIRRDCPCETAFRMRRRREIEHAENLQRRIKSTYVWLGDRWSSADFTKKTFDNFMRERQPMGYDMTRMFADMLRGTLILHGTYGTGKTHLLAALCNDLYTRPNFVECRFVTAPKLFHAIQSRISDRQHYDDLVAFAVKADLLVIDDIDKAKWTEFREEIYFDIIDERVNTGRPTAISTNKIDELTRFVGGAVASRLSVGLVEVDMSGEDYRREL